MHADCDRFVRLCPERIGLLTCTLDGIQSNRVDAAIGQLLPGVEYKAEVCHIGKIEGIETAVEDMEVRKHGRTTGYTEGIVTDESFDALVGMDHSDPSVVGLFSDQMRIERTSSFSVFGLGGDSGSLVVKKSERKAVGLYFAGPPSGIYGIANHLKFLCGDSFRKGRGNKVARQGKNLLEYG